MPKRSLIQQRPQSLASSLLKENFELRHREISPSSRKRQKLDTITWPVTTAPPLPELYLLQKTFIAVSSECIADIVDSIVQYASDHNLQGEYDSPNARAIFVIDDTEILIQLFLRCPSTNTKSCCIVEFMRAKGSVIIFHNVVIRMINALKRWCTSKGNIPAFLNYETLNETNAVEVIDLEALNKILSNMVL